MSKPKLIYLICRLLIILASGAKTGEVYANSISVNHDIIINSNKLTFDRSNNSAYFEGKVIVWFEDMILTTNSIKIIYKKDTSNKNQIDKVIIPHSLKLIKLEQEEALIAEQCIYYASESKLVLNEVKAIRGHDILKTAKLSYYTKLQKLDLK